MFHNFHHNRNRLDLPFPSSNLWRIGDSLSYDLQGHAGKQRNYHTCGYSFAMVALYVFMQMTCSWEEIFTSFTNTQN